MCWKKVMTQQIKKELFLLLSLLELRNQSALKPQYAGLENVSWVFFLWNTYLLHPSEAASDGSTPPDGLPPCLMGHPPSGGSSPSLVGHPPLMGHPSLWWVTPLWWVTHLSLVGHPLWWVLLPLPPLPFPCFLLTPLLPLTCQRDESTVMVSLWLITKLCS